LKVHLNPATDDLAIIENKTTLELAKQINKRILELQTGLLRLLNLVRNSETSLLSSPVRKSDLTITLAIGRLPGSLINTRQDYFEGNEAAQIYKVGPDLTVFAMVYLSGHQIIKTYVSVRYIINFLVV